MPEWMFTALADAKYSNAFVVEAPTMRAFQRLQRMLGQAFISGRTAGRSALLRRVLRLGVRQRKFPIETYRSVHIEAVPPSLESRDLEKQARTAGQLVQQGLLSKRTARVQLDLDPVAEEKRIEAEQPKQQQQQPQQPPDIASMFERLTEGFTGEITDTLGRKRYYVDGKQVARDHFADHRPDSYHIRNADGTSREVQRGEHAVSHSRELVQHIQAAFRSGSVEDLKHLADICAGFTSAQIHAARKELGISASGSRSVLVARLVKNASKALADAGHRTQADGTPVTPVRGAAYQVPVSSLHMDPSRFQFKLNTSAAGVTDQFHGVQSFNPDFAGVIAVWRDPADGKTYVVNGHHRTDLAKRLNHPTLSVRYLEAPSAEQARAMGALINIAEGRGTAIDAAKFMRDTGATVADFDRHGISLKEALAGQAVVLTKLSPGLFGRVVLGSLEPERAIAVASHLEDHALQEQCLKFIEKMEDETGKEYSRRTVEEAAMEMAFTPTHSKTTATLFGDETEIESTFMHRAELKGYVRAELGKIMRDFQAVANQRRAAAVSAAVSGNVLDTEANSRVAREAATHLEWFGRRVNMKGDPVAEIMNEGASKLAAARSNAEREKVRRWAVEQVQAELRRETVPGLDDKPKPPRDDTPSMFGDTPAEEPEPPADPTPAAEKTKEPWEVTRGQWSPGSTTTEKDIPVLETSVMDAKSAGWEKTIDHALHSTSKKTRTAAIAQAVLLSRSGGTGSPFEYAVIRSGNEWAVVRRRHGRTLGNPHEHETAVRLAVANGKPVPPEVLADYPDVAPQAPLTQAPPRDDHDEQAHRRDLQHRLEQVQAQIQRTKDAAPQTRYSGSTNAEIQQLIHRFGTRISDLKRAVRENPDDDGSREALEKMQPRFAELRQEEAHRGELQRLQRRAEALDEGIRTGKLTMHHEEMLRVLGNQRDSYHEAGYRGEYNPDLMKTSDLTGRKIRHYVELPDGRIAHPDELHLAQQRGRIVIEHPH